MHKMAIVFTDGKLLQTQLSNIDELASEIAHCAHLLDKCDEKESLSPIIHDLEENARLIHEQIKLIRREAEE